MVSDLDETGCRGSSEALKFWCRKTEHCSLVVSPSLFIKLEKAQLAAAERIISNLGAIEGKRKYSLLTTTLEKIEQERFLISDEISTITLIQTDMMQWEDSKFVYFLERVSE